MWPMDELLDKMLLEVHTKSLVDFYYTIIILLFNFRLGSTIIEQRTSKMRPRQTAKCTCNALVMHIFRVN